MDPRLPSLVALNGRITPSLSSFILSSGLREVMLARHGPSAASRLGVWSIRRPCSETPPLLRPRSLSPPIPGGALDHVGLRSEEHTSELQSRPHLVCRLL